MYPASISSADSGIRSSPQSDHVAGRPGSTTSHSSSLLRSWAECRLCHLCLVFTGEHLTWPWDDEASFCCPRVVLPSWKRCSWGLEENRHVGVLIQNHLQNNLLAGQFWRKRSSVTGRYPQAGRCHTYQSRIHNGRQTNAHISHFPSIPHRDDTHDFCAFAVLFSNLECAKIAP